MNPTADAPARSPGSAYFASHWRSLDYFNLYRLTLAVALIFIGLLLTPTDLFTRPGGARFQLIAFAYLIVSALFVLGIRARWPGFQIQLTAHIFTDILIVILLMSASARLAGGLGLLLVISIASGGLVGSGRLTLLYAAVASLAVLLQQSFAILRDQQSMDSLFLIGLLCAGYFAIGWLAHALTRRALVSERLAQQQSEELALLNRINALAIENSPDGLIAVRGDGVIRHASARAISLIGRAILPGQTRLNECAPLLWQAMTQQLAKPTDAAVITLASRVRVRCIPLAMPDDSRVLILEDESQAEQAAQRLKLAALGRLTANIAHEIRNPLSAISHAAQLLSEESHDPAQGKLAQIIENNARRLDRLVEEVLTLNRRDRLNPVEFNATSLAALIDELARTEAIPREAITVTLNPALRFSFDPDHLRQIVWNLLRNAWRACSRQPGCLAISGETTDQGMSLTFADDGAGVSAGNQNKLFEPFFTTDAQGTGLGLFLARELADANRATLAYAPGAGGACFRLTLTGER